MKTERLWFILTLLTFVTLTFVPNSFAQHETPPANTVGVIYFLPTGRTPHQDIDAKLDTLLTTVQTFYGNEMARNGFGRKTFKLQTDTNGKTVVHHINGQFNAEYYNGESGGTFDKVLSEIRGHIDMSKNIYFIAADVTDATFPLGAWRGGGQALIGSHAIVYIPFDSDFVDSYVAGHEIGHSFGLMHDFRFTAEGNLMSYDAGIDLKDRRLSRCAAEWLDVHPYFNDTQTSLNEPVTIRMLPPLEYPPNAISLRFDITDPDGLHQAQLVIPREAGFSLHGCKSLNGEVNSVIEFITTELTARTNNTVEIGIIDVHGRFSWKQYSIPIDDIEPVDGVINVDSSAAAKVRIVSGNEQNGYLNSRLINPFVVTVRDANDEPVAGVQVTFQVVAGDGTLSVTNPWTDSEGLAQTYFTLGDSRTESRVTANVDGVSDQAIFNAAVSEETVVTTVPLKTFTGGSVGYSRDSSTLAISDSDGIRLWDVTTGEPKKVLIGYTQEGISGTFSPDELSIVSGRIWRKLPTLKGNSTWYISDFAYSPDGDTLATGNLDGEIHLWDASTGQYKTTFTGHTGNIASLTFSPDGRMLASGSTANNDKTVRLWDAATGQQLKLFRPPGDPYGDGVGVAFNDDGSTLATIWGWDLTVLLYDTTSGQQIKALTGHTTGVYAVAFSPDGDTLATGSFSGAIRLWDPVTGSIQKILIGHTDAVKSLTFSPDGNTLASVGEDGTVHLWAIDNMPNAENAEITESKRRKEDVNGDGDVNIADLVLVAGALNKTGQKHADVNGDGDVNIADLVLVAGALNTSAAAPSLDPQLLSTLTAADVKQWLSQAQQLSLTDDTSLRGIQFLEQLLAVLTPKQTALLPNYPNPFNPETWIPYHLAKNTDVTLYIYAMNGTLVRTLAIGHQTEGVYQSRSHAAYWDGKNTLGESVASGVYFYVLKAGDFSATRKMLIMK